MENIDQSIEIRNVNKSFYTGNGEILPVLRDISFKISSDSFTTLIGPNGCGKTTLLRIIAGLDVPDSGDVIVKGSKNSSIQVGYVWQNYRSSLLPWFDVGENVAFPLRLHGVERQSRRQIAGKLVDEFMPGISLKDRTYQLSGGQQQLVSVLRSLVVEPDVLLLDEPFSALDQERRWVMGSYVEKAWLKISVPIVFVSHDVDEAVLLADSILLMSRRSGKIDKELKNPLPRPRSQNMLTAKEHLTCRSEILDFLFDEEKGF